MEAESHGMWQHLELGTTLTQSKEVGLQSSMEGNSANNVNELGSEFMPRASQPH